jgi:chemotaxis protein methyltransferase CheR
MSHGLSDALLGPFSDLLAARLGLRFAKDRWPALGLSMAAAAKELEFPDALSCVRGLLSSAPTRKEIEILASHLTVGETYFFREPKSFEALKRHILPELIGRRSRGERTLRIWSAGCCSGEEPYSVAILIDSLLSDLRDWNVTILATDINQRFLRQATEGVYTEWSFRGVPAETRERYFLRRAPNRFEILPRIKRMVHFAYLNLAEDPYPSLLNSTNAMDVVLCRNVLMYFCDERARHVVLKLHHALTEGGWLIVSPVETSATSFHGFASVGFSGMTLYRKGGQAEVLPAAFTALPASGVSDSAAAAISAPQPAREDPLAEEPVFLLAAAASPDQAPALDDEACDARAEATATPVTPAAADGGVGIASLARACANEGKLAEALEWCGKGLAANRLDPGLHYLSAMIQQERGELAAAAAALKRALYIDPDFVLAHFALANLARLGGKSEEARKGYGNALALLAKCDPEAVLPEADGIIVERLKEIIDRTRQLEVTG